MVIDGTPGNEPRCIGGKPAADGTIGSGAQENGKVCMNFWRQRAAAHIIIGNIDAGTEQLLQLFAAYIGGFLSHGNDNDILHDVPSNSIKGKFYALYTI